MVKTVRLLNTGLKHIQVTLKDDEEQKERKPKVNFNLLASKER